MTVSPKQRKQDPKQRKRKHKYDRDENIKIKSWHTALKQTEEQISKR